jgi:cytochrome c-type biogenesis protein
MAIALPTAFAAGMLSFLSPCVLPLAPPYLAFLAGTSLDRLAQGAEAAVPARTT